MAGIIPILVSQYLKNLQDLVALACTSREYASFVTSRFYVPGTQRFYSQLPEVLLCYATNREEELPLHVDLEQFYSSIVHSLHTLPSRKLCQLRSLSYSIPLLERDFVDFVMHLDHTDLCVVYIATTRTAVHLEPYSLCRLDTVRTEVIRCFVLLLYSYTLESFRTGELVKMLVDNRISRLPPPLCRVSSTFVMRHRPLSVERVLSLSIDKRKRRVQATHKNRTPMEFLWSNDHCRWLTSKQSHELICPAISPSSMRIVLC